MNLIKIIFFILCLYSSYLKSQTTINSEFEDNSIIYKKRLYTVLAGGSVLYGGTLIGLSQFWYKGHEKSRFHFFNDNKEWLQMDKAGHLFSAYFINSWTAASLSWAGLAKNTAITYGAFYSLTYLLTVEALDGFSAKWGASTGDMLADLLGVSLFWGQEAIWNQQKILVKFSYYPIKYDIAIKNRVDDLYGHTFSEKLLKDYNGQTYWVSANIHSFLKPNCCGCLFPRWLNVSFGYSANGMLGGFENKWLENNIMVNKTDVIRYRQWYISLDIDFTRIKTRSALLRSIYNSINIIKIPFPAIELNQNGLKFHAVYF